jgi:PIN domain nuclease of toxin-antitoxin system
MNLLLDTHVLIWFLNGDNQLQPVVKEQITDATNTCFIGIASIWEMAIKSSLNKLELAGSFDQIAGFLYQSNIELLPITLGHIQQLLQLPFHHRDPFDRIIIAQAINEGLTLATKDAVLYQYQVATIWK